MKCANCGAELRTGCIFCSSCGKEAQIVPDYNVLDDDDYINSLINETDNKVKQTVSADKADIAKANKDKAAALKKKKKQRNILICISSVVIIAVVLAIVIFNNVKNQQYNSFEYQVEQARIACDAGNYTSAVKYYERAIEINNSNIEIKLELADVYILRQDIKSAMALYYDVISADNKNIVAYTKLIEIYEKKKDYDNIISLMNTTEDSKVLELFSSYIVSGVKFSVNPGEYDSFFDVAISGDADSTIYYTLDGEDPIENGKKYSSAIELNKEGEFLIKAVAKNSKGLYSELVEAKYIISIPAPDMATVSPEGGNFSSETTVYISVPVGCTAYYTWDSTDPTTSSSKYTGPIDVPEGNNILSVILVDDATGKVSDIFRGHYELYL